MHHWFVAEYLLYKRLKSITLQGDQKFFQLLFTILPTGPQSQSLGYLLQLEGLEGSEQFLCLGGATSGMPKTWPISCLTT